MLNRLELLERKLVFFIAENRQMDKRIKQLEAAAANNPFNKKKMPNEDEGINRQALFTPRSCSELKSVEPLSPSGNYLIDPDGTGAGDPPFSVYCDMAGNGESPTFYLFH